MKEIIFDSSTLILLAKITMLREVSKDLKIIISQEVHRETTEKQNLFDAKLIISLINEVKISKINANQEIASKFMKDFNINKGEAETLSIAKNERYVIATDDGPTIKACRILNIKFATAIQFLINSYVKRRLTKEMALEKLKNLENYGRYKEEILINARRKIEGG